VTSDQPPIGAKMAAVVRVGLLTIWTWLSGRTHN